MSAHKAKIVIDFLQLPRTQAKAIGKKRGQATKGSAPNRKPNDASSPSKRIMPVREELKAREDALKEAYKEIFKTHHSQEEKLNDLVDKSENVLTRIRNLVPVFTDELVIDSNKITVINRPFFFSEHIQSISIKNINDVYIQTMPFIATIHIVDVGMAQSHIIHMKWFLKKDAEKARRMITGLMEATKEEVDIKNLDAENLGYKLEELGKVKGTHTTVSGA